MRIDRGPGQILRFDNMEDREANGALKGDTDWTPRTIVLEVPDDAASINFAQARANRSQADPRRGAP
jgi:hypothetical protein